MGSSTYKIKYGDTLTDIAKTYNTTVDAIAKENNITDPNIIYAGNTLKITTGSGNTGGTVKTQNNGGTFSVAKSKKKTGTQSIGTGKSTGIGTAYIDKAKSTLGSSNVLDALDKLNGGDIATAGAAAATVGGLAISGAGAALGTASGAITSLISAGKYLEAEKKYKELVENFPEYQRSEELQKLYDQLETLRTSPPEWADQYKDAVAESFAEIQNREKFNYDFTDDPMYEQYREKYMQEGKTAMQDTVADVSALSGGYANSYAATAGSQAYQGYVQKLNDVIPTLRQMALEQYKMEGEELYNKFDAARSIRSDDLNKFLSVDMENWKTQYNQALQMASMLSEEEWNKYIYEEYNPTMQQIADAQSDKQFYSNQVLQGASMATDSLTNFGNSVAQYGTNLAELAMQNYQFEQDYALQQQSLEQDAAQWEQEYALSKLNSDRDYEISKLNSDRDYEYKNASLAQDKLNSDRDYEIAKAKLDTQDVTGIDRDAEDEEIEYTYDNVMSWIKDKG